MEEVKASGYNDDTLDPFVLAFRKAFEQKPDMIIFLTDGSFDDKLIQEVRNMNKNNCVINTLAYIKVGANSEVLLKKMADENKGKYKFVSAKEIN